MSIRATERRRLGGRERVLVGCAVGLLVAVVLEGVEHWLSTISSTGFCGGAVRVVWRLDPWLPAALLGTGGVIAWLGLRRRRGLSAVVVGLGGLVVATGLYLDRWYLPADHDRYGSGSQGVFCYGPPAGSRAQWAFDWETRLNAPVRWLVHGAGPAVVVGAITGLVAVLTVAAALLPPRVAGPRWRRREWALGAVLLGLVAAAWLPWWQITTSASAAAPGGPAVLREHWPLWSASAWWGVAVLLGVVAGFLWLRRRGPDVEPPRWLPRVVLAMLAGALLLLGARTLTAPTDPAADSRGYSVHQASGPGVLVGAGLLLLAVLLVGSVLVPRRSRPDGDDPVR